MDKSVAFWNGKIIPSHEARLSLNDAGFTIGVIVSDFCRTFNHKLFRLGDHVQRFRRSCVAASIAMVPGDEEICAQAEKVVAHNASLVRPGEELVLILIATPGPVGEAVLPTFGIYTFVLPYARYRSFFEEGVRLVTPPTRQLSAWSVAPSVKHRSRLHYWLANTQAHQLAGAAALVLDREDNITETSIASFLLVRDGGILSPPSSTILDGISLATVRELCAELAIPFVERTLTLSDCRSEDEAMLAGTAFCLAGVRSINGRALRWPGPIFEKLLAAWSERVGVDIRGQFS